MSATAFSFTHNEQYTVFATFHKGQMAYRAAGNFDRFLEPDDPDEIEINKVIDASGADVTEALTDEQFSEIESAAFKAYDRDHDERDNPGDEYEY